MAVLRLTILGCGSSGGVPRLGGLWGDCDPANPRNRRLRAAAIVERITDHGTTTVAIDTGSAPLNAMRQCDRSRPSTPCASARRAHTA